MKKLNYFFILFLALVLGCQKDEVNNINENSLSKEDIIKAFEKKGLDINNLNFFEKKDFDETNSYKINSLEELDTILDIFKNIKKSNSVSYNIKSDSTMITNIIPSKNKISNRFRDFDDRGIFIEKEGPITIGYYPRAYIRAKCDVYTYTDPKTNESIVLLNPNYLSTGLTGLRPALSLKCLGYSSLNKGKHREFIIQVTSELHLNVLTQNLGTLYTQIVKYGVVYDTKYKSGYWMTDSNSINFEDIEK